MSFQNTTNQPIMIDVSEPVESSPIQAKDVDKSTAATTNYARTLPANSILADIATVFPNVMVKEVDLPSEAIQSCGLVIEDKHLKGTKVAGKCKEEKPAHLARDKKAGYKPRGKNPAHLPKAANTMQMEQHSDDDFDNPPWKKKQKQLLAVVSVKNTRPPVSLAKDSANTGNRTEITIPYLPLADEILSLLTAMKHMGELVQSFNEDQRNSVTNIGFGAILGFRMGQVPTSLGLWLVKNYDHRTRVLNCGSHHIPITEELVQEIFGVPRGKVAIQEVERPRADYHEVVAEWKCQFEQDPKRLTPVQFKTYMQTQEDSGRTFVLIFLIFYNTILGEANHNSSLNMRFLQPCNENLISRISTGVNTCYDVWIGMSKDGCQ